MTVAVIYKLLAIAFTVALGWAAGRMRWLGSGTDHSDPARVLSNAAFYIFVPALLLRTTVGLDFAVMPWRAVWAYFLPAAALLLAGLAWNATGLGLHPVVDETLFVLGSAVVPLCLVLIGPSLAYYGTRGDVRGAFGLSLLKLLVMPALVLVVAHWGFGLAGVPLGVLVVMAALPAGSNPLVFAQRYGTLAAEATAAIVFSTLAFAAALLSRPAVSRTIRP